MRASWLACSTVALLSAGCNLQRFTVRLTAPVIARGMRSFEAESILSVARDAAPAQLEQVAGMLETDPENRILLEQAARGFALYGFGFVEDDLESLPEDAAHADRHRALVADATEAYDRAFRYAVRLLATYDRDLPRAVAGDEAGLRAAVARLDARAAPALALAGLAIASALQWNRADPARAVDLPKAIVLLERSRALDPRYDRGAAAMILGIVFAQPAAVGGRPEEARALFAESIAVTGGRYLFPRVMLARAYCVAVSDRALFRKTLEAVLAERPDAYPEARLANEMARRRAARYLADESRLFR